METPRRFRPDRTARWHIRRTAARREIAIPCNDRGTGIAPREEIRNGDHANRFTDAFVVQRNSPRSEGGKAAAGIAAAAVTRRPLAKTGKGAGSGPNT